MVRDHVDPLLLPVVIALVGSFRRLGFEDDLVLILQDVGGVGCFLGEPFLDQIISILGDVNSDPFPP